MRFADGTVIGQVPEANGAEKHLKNTLISGNDEAKQQTLEEAEADALEMAAQADAERKAPAADEAVMIFTDGTMSIIPPFSCEMFK